MNNKKDWIAILDFGSQYTHLIARRIRECGVYSEIIPCAARAEEILKNKPSALILSGGPASVTQSKAPVCDKNIFQLGIPVLGICYGAQLMASLIDGRVIKAKAREYGKAILNIKKQEGLFKGLAHNEQVWMSHGDRIAKLPKGFKVIGYTRDASVAAMADTAKNFYGLQFHPEVVHTIHGKKILENFLFKISKCRRSWEMKSFIKSSIDELKEKVGKDKVLCALSGGVDSSVLSILIKRAIGKNLVAVFIDNGLLRKNEARMVNDRFRKHYKVNLIFVKAENIFLKALKGVVNPEKKRKIIGRTFIKLFEREAKKIGSFKYLAQGTLYPDVIESVSAFGGPSAVIKTHHNVGGLPKRLKFDLIEPLRYLFKDEVRALGSELGLPEEIVNRHPFPGPGLAIRIIGEVTKEKLNILRAADWILMEEIKRSNLYSKLWQSFCVLLPIKTVGVMGDERTYEKIIAIRAVNSVDAMTAQWARLPYDVLENISNRIVNEVKGVNRVVYDISSKPPSTIEWE
ncbi:MAG: glutamine-hydrolyzing GMP synthase [bacterium]